MPRIEQELRDYRRSGFEFKYMRSYSRWLTLDRNVSHYYISWSSLDRVTTFLRHTTSACGRNEVLGWCPANLAMPAYYCIQDCQIKNFAPQHRSYRLDLYFVHQFHQQFKYNPKVRYVKCAQISTASNSNDYCTVTPGHPNLTRIRYRTARSP